MNKIANNNPAVVSIGGLTLLLLLCLTKLTACCVLYTFTRRQ